jgi:hypothetical protein
VGHLALFTLVRHLFRDDHTAVDAGNVLHGKNFMYGTENKSAIFRSSSLWRRV